jgi:ATP-dependent Lon protease
VVWIATANEARAIPEPILNRVNVYEIDAPDADAARRIARGIYRELRNEHSWGQQFPEEPAASMIDRLAQLKPREMRRVLLAAFGNAKLSQRQEVIAEDVTAERVVRKARIGF